jgi:hypothetical protein
MNAYSSPSDDFSNYFEETMETLGREFHRAVSYVDKVVVPEVRRESGGALRFAAIHLERWADKMDPAGARPWGTRS